MISIPKEDITGAQLADIRTQLGMTTKDFCDRLGISGGTYSNWVTGKFHINPAVLPKLRRLARAHEKARKEVEAPAPKTATRAKDSKKKKKVEEEVIDVAFEEVEAPVVVPPPTPKKNGLPIYVTPEGVRKMRKDAKLTQEEFAQKIGVSSNYLSKWERGALAVTPRYFDALRNLWHGQEPDHVAGTVPPPRGKALAVRTPAGMRLDRPLAPEPLLEMSSEFFAQYRSERNRRDVEAILAFASQKSGVQPELLRKMMAVILLALKQEMSVEEMYRCLTGHTS